MYRLVWPAVPYVISPREQERFPGSANYWEERYASGGTSGAGSYGQLALFKAKVINSVVSENRIASVIEFGCGDGNQLKLANYPHYVGFDVSSKAIDLCRENFESDTTKSFFSLDAYTNQSAELALSLDVIYHLVEDRVFEDYMRRLFAAGERFVIIYSSNTDDNYRVTVPHVRHRLFTEWVRANCKGWSLKTHTPNKYPGQGHGAKSSFADFYIYQRDASRTT